MNTEQRENFHDRHYDKGEPLLKRITVILLLTGLLGTAQAQSFDTAEEALDHWRGDLALEMLEVDGDEPDAASLRLYGRARMQLGENEAAIEAFEQAMELEPDNPDSHMLLASVLSNEASDGGIRQARRIRSLAEEAAELDPEDPMPRWALFLYYHHVPAILGGTSGRAERQHEALAEIDPHWASAADGMLRLDDDDLEAAREAFQEAWNEGAGADVATNLSQVLAEQEDWQALFALKQQWLEAEPGHPRVLYRLGRRAATLGDEAGEQNLQAGREALASYTEREFVPEGLPSRAAAFWRKGQILDALGDPEAASGAWKRALEIDPDYEEARQALEQAQPDAEPEPPGP